MTEHQGQCGRAGYNGFGIIPEATHEPTGQVVGSYLMVELRSGVAA